MIGQLVNGKYQITRLLGQGGMGAVYEAIHTGTGRHVALKMIITGEASVSHQMIGRFQREARAAGAIDTQHIVQVLDTGTDATLGLPFMVMELLKGEDLQQLMQRMGSLAPDLVLRIAAQVCVALQKAHDAGVVHRDIKPANLYLTHRDGGEVIVKLLDFGIAKIKQDQLSSSDSQGLTKTGSMLGSPLYMSPEQAKGLKTIDQRTDLWSLGAVLYEALTGRTPHHGIDTLGQIIIAICSEPPPLVQNFAPWVSPEVAAIVHGALTLDVGERFQTASSMLDAIRPHLPDGWSVRDSMVAPLSTQYRALVAPRLAISVGGAKLAMSGPLSVSGSLPSGTEPGLAHTTDPKRSSSLGWLLLAPLIAAGGFGTWKMLHRHFDAEVAGGGPASVLVAEPPKAPPSIVSAEPILPAAAAPSMRSARLAIVPVSAVVEIDGQRASVDDGGVEIKGTLGSLHSVRVSSGGRETMGEVVVTESGAMPPKLELGVVAPKPRRPNEGGQAASPVPAATGTKASASAAGTKPASPALDKKFE